MTIFAIFENPIESKDLYKEVEFLKLNVTDMVDEVLVYGDIDQEYLSIVMCILLKYGVNNVTLRQRKPP